MGVGCCPARVRWRRRGRQAGPAGQRAKRAARAERGERGRTLGFGVRHGPSGRLRAERGERAGLRGESQLGLVRVEAIGLRKGKEVGWARVR